MLFIFILLPNRWSSSNRNSIESFRCFDHSAAKFYNLEHLRFFRCENLELLEEMKMNDAFLRLEHSNSGSSRWIFFGRGGESVGGNGCGECVWDDRRWGRSLLLLRWPSWKKEMMSRFVSGSRSTSSVVRWRTITSANCPSRAPRFPWRRGENRVLDKIFRAEWNTAPDWLKEGRHITGSHRALNFKMLFLQPSEVVCLASSDRIV